MNYEYKGVNAEGRSVKGELQAASRQEALELLSVMGLQIIGLRRATVASALRTRKRRRKANVSDKALLLKQFAVMIRAGVALMECLEALRSSNDVEEIRQGLAGVMAAVRQGDRLSSAMEKEMHIFPGYVYSLIGVGETSGQLAEVLEDAAAQTERAERLRKDAISALTYPGVLMAAVFLGVLFLIYRVIPTFGGILQDAERLTPLSRFVLSAGELAENHGVALMAGILAGCAGLFFLFRTQKQLLYKLSLAIPIIGRLAFTLEKSSWARIHNLSLMHGVTLLHAAALSAQALPEGAFASVVRGSAAKLRRGERLEKIYADSGLLTSVETGLLQAGGNTGRLPEIFGYMADRYEQEVGDQLKRLMTLLEPLAIVLVTLILGTIMVAIFSALLGVYETVG